MALSLVLRGASKIEGCSSLLRCSLIAFRHGNFVTLPQSINRASFSLAQKASVLQLQCSTPSHSVVRSMSVGDHRKKWAVERLLSVLLVGLMPLTVMRPHEILDNLTSVVMVLHLHWGVEAVVQDYVRPIIFGNVIPKIAIISVYAISAFTLGGLLYFNYTDIGIGCFTRKLWEIEPC